MRQQEPCRADSVRIKQCREATCMVNSKPWMACRRLAHGPGNMSDRRRADRTEPVPSRRVNRVCRRHDALPTAGKSGEKTVSTSPLGHGRNFGTCKSMQRWNAQCMCLLWMAGHTVAMFRQTKVGRVDKRGEDEAVEIYPRFACNGLRARAGVADLGDPHGQLSN